MSKPAGTGVCVSGENGIGKSTLLRCVAGLQRPDEGEIAVFGEDEEKILIWEQEHLAVAIAAALPDALAVFEIDTGENAGLQAVGVTFVNDGVVEIRFKRQRGPAGVIFFRPCNRNVLGAPA